MKCRRVSEKRLGQIFKEKGLIGERQIEEALLLQKKNGDGYSFGAALVALGFVEEEHIVEGIVRQYRIPICRQIGMRLISTRLLLSLRRWPASIHLSLSRGMAMC